MWFSTFIFKNIARRPMRSALTVVAIAIAIGAVVSLVGIARGFEESFLELYSKLKVDLMVVSGGAGKRKIERPLPASWGEEIKKIDGVAGVLPGLVDTISFEELGPTPVVINGWEPESLAFEHLKLLDGGRMLKKGDKYKAMLGTVVASNLGKKAGDKINLFGKEDFEIVGVFESFNVYDNGSIVISLADAQDILDRKDQVTGYSIVLTPEARSDADRIKQVRGRITTLLLNLEARSLVDAVRQQVARDEKLSAADKARLRRPWDAIDDDVREHGFTNESKDRARAALAALEADTGVGTALKKQVARTGNDLLRLDERNSTKALSVREHIDSLVELKMARAMAWLTSAIALIIGLFGMMNTMVMSVHERTREIGILRAVGWKPRRVLGMVLCEAVALSQVGALAGIAGSVLVLRLLSKAPMVNNLISTRLHYGLAAWGVVIAAVVGLIGGLLPAVRAGRLLPTAALRQE